MISSRQIFSCTVLSVSSVFVSVACAFSLCSKAWSIFQENVIPVPGLFTHSRLHQRSETSSPRFRSRYKSARVHAQQHRCEYSGDICYANQASSWQSQLGPKTALCNLSKLPICPVWLSHHVVLKKLTHTCTQILSQYVRLSSWWQAATRPLTWVGSPSKHATCCPAPPQSVTRK